MNYHRGRSGLAFSAGSRPVEVATSASPHLDAVLPYPVHPALSHSELEVPMLRRVASSGGAAVKLRADTLSFAFRLLAGGVYRKVRTTEVVVSINP